VIDDEFIESVQEGFSDEFLLQRLEDSSKRTVKPVQKLNL